MKIEDWKKVEDGMLTHPLANPRLNVDGRTVRLHNVRDKQRIVIAVYVDGWIKGEWLNPKKPCPEQAYMRKCEKNLFKKKEREEYAKFAKQFGKREAKKYLPDMTRTYVFFTPYFPSVRAIRLQYEKNFKSIELVTE